MENHEVDPQRFWNEESALWANAESNGGLSNVVAALSQGDLKKAFESPDPNNDKEKCMCCIDEGTQEKGPHAAGSGIYYVVTHGLEKGLSGQEALDAGLNRAKDVFFGIDHVAAISSHDECGAAALVFSKMPADLQAQFGSSDELGDWFAEKLAHMLDVPYVGRLPLTYRPSGLHVASCTYLTAHPHFKPSAVAALPKGFVVTMLGDEEQALKEVELSVAIATGNHGFGPLITRESPFRLVAVGETEKLKPLLAKIAADPKYDGKLRVDFVNIP